MCQALGSGRTVGRNGGCDAGGQGGQALPTHRPAWPTTWPFAGVGATVLTWGCDEALTVPRSRTNAFPWLLLTLGRLAHPPRKWPPAQWWGTPAGLSPPPHSASPACRGRGARRSFPLVWLRRAARALFPPLGPGGGSHGATYQEAFEFLRLRDVDPAVLLHHLDVLHLVIEPGRRARASAAAQPSVRARHGCAGARAWPQLPAPAPAGTPFQPLPHRPFTPPQPSRPPLLAYPSVGPPCWFGAQTPGQPLRPQAPKPHASRPSRHIPTQGSARFLLCTGTVPLLRSPHRLVKPSQSGLHVKGLTWAPEAEGAAPTPALTASPSFLQFCTFLPRPAEHQPARHSGPGPRPHPVGVLGQW